MSELKWCCHCRKDDHDDKECWSTRAVTPHPASSILPMPFTAPPFKAAPMSDELRIALLKVGIRPKDVS